MSLLTDPTIQAALQAVNRDQEELSLSAEATKAAVEKACIASSVEANAKQHLEIDVQALYAAIEATTGIPPKNH